MYTLLFLLDNQPETHCTTTGGLDLFRKAWLPTPAAETLYRKFVCGMQRNNNITPALDVVSSPTVRKCFCLQEFVAGQIDTVFRLSRPMAALRLRFNIHDGLMTPSGRLCWHLTLLGCTLAEGENKPPLLHHTSSIHNM